MTTDRQFRRAVDRAISAENRAAIRDWYNPYTGEVKYHAGTSEYEAYVAKLRIELAKWVAKRVAHEGEYAYTGTDSTAHNTEED